MTWKVTTNNNVRRDVYSAFEVDDEVLEELGLDPQDEEDMCKDVIKYRGEWYNLHDFTVDLPDALKEQGWWAWQTHSHWSATLMKRGVDTWDESLPVMGWAVKETNERGK